MFREKMMRLAAGLLSLMLAGTLQAQVVIDNGIAGDGFWQVASDDAGDSTEGLIDPTGPLPPSDVIFRFSAYYDVGADGQDGLLQDGTTSPATLTNPGEVSSAGTFPGPNGTINWTAVATILPGSPLYTVRLEFSSNQPFGVTRIINYFDEDVLGAGSDVLVVIGTPGDSDFQLLTIDSNEDVGVAMAADYFGATNMTWAGWAAEAYPGVPSVFSVEGEINELSATTDPRFPSSPVYGPADITAHLAWDFDPTATSASMTVALGGSPDGTAPPIEPPPPPPVRGQLVPVPVDNALALALLGLLMVAVGMVALRRPA